MIITISARTASRSAIPRGVPSKNAGTGQFHIEWPMEKYMRTSKNVTEEISLLFRTGVSLSRSASSSCASFSLADSPAFCCSCAPRLEAPYPASSTALMICASDAVPSTPMEFVSRLTEHSVTPGTFETAFSTRAWQAAQLIPVTVYCSI